MKKKIKTVIIILLVITIVPALFFKKGKAEEYPIATPDQADFEEIMDTDIGTQNLIGFDFFNEMINGSTSLGRIGRLTFDMKFEVQYINAFLQVSNSEQGFVGFTTDQQLMFMHLYELAWIHILFESTLSLMVAGGFYKFLKNNLS